MTDQAPLSSGLVRQKLFRHIERGDIVDRLLVNTTILATPAGKYTAVTTVTRPSNWEIFHLGPADLSKFDAEVAQAFKSLYGYAGSYAITMGRMYSVEWDGISRPV